MRLSKSQFWSTVAVNVFALTLAIPFRSVLAAETLIKSSAVNGSFSVVDNNGSGLLAVGGVTWDSSGGGLGITKIVITLYTTSGTCATLDPYLFQGTALSGTQTNKVYTDTASPTITTTQTSHTFLFTPTYDADDTIGIGFDGNCGGTVRLRTNNASQSWGAGSGTSADDQGIGMAANPYQVPVMEIYGDTIAPPLGDFSAAIEKPVMGNYTAPVPLRVGTDVLASDVDGSGQGVAFQVLLEAYSGSWSEYDTYEYTDADAPLTYTCSTLFAGTFAGPCVKLGSVVDTFTLPDLPDGNYRVSARVAVIEADVTGDYGVWSSVRTFTVGEASPISSDIAGLFTAGSASEECGAANPWETETTGWDGFIDGIKRALWGFFWIDCITTQPLVDLRDQMALHAPFRQAFQTLGYFVDALNNAQAPEDTNLSIPAPPPWEGSEIVIFSPQAVYDFMGGEDGWGTLVRPLIAAGTALALGLYFVRDWSNFFGTNA